MSTQKHNKTETGIFEFQQKYNTEEKCREYLFKCRFPGGYKCPKCGHNEYYFLKTRNLYKCKKCYYQMSVTSGTVMDRTHIKLTIWLWAMYLFTIDKRGCSAKQLQRMLKLPYKTAWFVLQRLRSTMKSRDEKYMLKGVVELDDTFVGTPTKGKRGRGTDKMIIEVAVSKTDDGKPKFIKMECLPNLRGTTIGKFAKKNIEEKSIIESDACQSYKKPLADFYMHVYEIFSQDKEMLKWLHTIVSNLKAFIAGTYHGIEKKHVDLYLAEFCFRFNRRFFFENIYQRLAISVVCAQPCRFNLLVGEKK